MEVDASQDVDQVVENRYSSMEEEAERRRRHVLDSCSRLLRNSRPQVRPREEDDEDAEEHIPVKHVKSFKKLEQEIKDSNALKKEDREALIDYLEEQGIEEKEIGDYIVRIISKPVNTISKSQLTKIPDIPASALDKIFAHMNGLSKKKLEVKNRNGRKKKKTSEQASENNSEDAN